MGSNPTASAIFLAFSLALFSLCTALCVPLSQAHAAEAYTVDRVSIEAQVQTNADLYVIEQRVITFSRATDSVAWHLRTRSGDEEGIEMHAVRWALLDDQGSVEGEWQTLTSLRQAEENARAAALAQAEAEGLDALTSAQRADEAASAALESLAGAPLFSLDPLDDIVSLSFGFEPRQYLVEVEYTALEAATPYRDVAEIAWRYISEWDVVGVSDVTLRVTLPVPFEMTVVPNGNVYAWGHGPASGSYTIGADGSITYTTPEVLNGQYSECRIIFPVAWLSNIGELPQATASQYRRANAIGEEQNWVDRWAGAIMSDYRVRIGCAIVGAIALVVLLASLLLARRRGAHSLVPLRIAATMGVIAVAEQLFFKDALSTIMLAVVGLVALFAYWALSIERREADGEAAEQQDDREGDQIVEPASA